ncbi:BAR/IMD domain-containing adapter protein 2-like 2 [Neosynchiropus ocellatus]
MSTDQLHRSTLGIYSNLMEEFNPSLQKLVSLGNSYVRAFHALAASSEAYFSALSRIGEQALRSVSSQPIGDVLVQISNSQRSLTTQLESVFHWFTVDVLQEMDNNVRQDRGYISSSRRHYETEVRERAAAQERQRRRGAAQDAGEYVKFLRESHGEALSEEERRYRFVAEKHSGLMQTVTALVSKTGASLQQRADVWREELEATRGAARGRTSGGPDHGQKAATREESRVRASHPPEEAEGLGKVPSRAPSPQGSVCSVTVDTVRARGRAVRARVAHQPAGSNPTLLSFSRGDSLTALVQQPRNGWLYGCLSGGSRKGWFPASYVEEVDGGPQPDLSRGSSLQGSGASPATDRPRSESQPPPPAPPPPPPPSHSGTRPTSDRRTESNLESKREQPQRSHPELFPRGTNPFATVKLRPTLTDDRSAPR